MCSRHVLQGLADCYECVLQRDAVEGEGSLRVEDARRVLDCECFVFWQEGLELIMWAQRWSSLASVLGSIDHQHLLRILFLCHYYWTPALSLIVHHTSHCFRRIQLIIYSSFSSC
jgi:hypothetical protein